MNPVDLGNARNSAFPAHFLRIGFLSIDRDDGTLNLLCIGLSNLRQVEPCSLEDKDLLEKLRDPDTKNYGFNMLVRKYQQKVYWLVRKMVISHDDADDLTQEVFIKIHKNIHTFRQDSQLYTWIYRIATNESLNFLQRRKRRLLLRVGDLQSDLTEKLISSPHISGDEVQLRLQKALLTLPEKQRLVFNLKYFDDLSYEEMAAITKTSVGALKASYHLAVKKVENQLKEN